MPTAEAQGAEALAGMQRDAAAAGERPAKKLAATAEILRDILAAIPDDLPGVRDRALPLLGRVGAIPYGTTALCPVRALRLKCGALTTDMDRGVHPTKLKRLGRHKSYTCSTNTSRLVMLSTATPSTACCDPKSWIVLRNAASWLPYPPQPQQELGVGAVG